MRLREVKSHIKGPSFGAPIPTLTSIAFPLYAFAIDGQSPPAISFMMIGEQTRVTIQKSGKQVKK